MSASDVARALAEELAALEERVASNSASIVSVATDLSQFKSHEHKQYSLLHDHPYAPIDGPPEPPPPPPPEYEQISPQTVENQSNVTFDHVKVDINGTSPNQAFMFRNCDGVRLTNVQAFGGGIYFIDCKNVEVDLALADWDRPGNPGWSDQEAGIRFIRTKGALVSNSVSARADCLLRVNDSEDIEFNGCHTYNPRGPFPRGQHFQTWRDFGERSRNIRIRNHYSLTDFLNPGSWPVFQEDAFSFGGCDEILIENVLNEMVSPQDGSQSGSGLMFEGASGATIRKFTSLNQSNVGFGVSGGSSVDLIEDSLLYVPRNPRANQAGFAWQRSSVNFGENVHLHGIKPDGGPYGSWWSDGTCTITGLDGTNRQHSETSHAIAEANAVERPSIPNVGFEM